jgi:site-specific recombinase XerD
MSASKYLVSPPVKVDRKGKVIVGTGKAHRWRITIPASVTGTQRKRLFFKTEMESKAKVALYNENRAGLGVTQTAQLSERGMTVEDAVAYTLKNAPILSTMSVEKLLDDYVKHRTNEVKVTERYLATLRSYFAKIKASFGETLLHDVTRKAIRDFLDGLKSKDGKRSASTATRNHYLETFRALFAYAKEERFVSTSPTDGISTSKTDGEPVSVLSVDEVAKLLEVLSQPEHSEVAAAAMIQLFAGPRRSELPYIRWEMFRGRFLRLDKVKRGTRSRPIEIPDTLLDWLAPLRQKSGYVFAPPDLKQDRDGDGETNPSESRTAIHLAVRACEDGYSWRLQKAAAAAGIKIPKNVLRHTAVTMRVNATGDIPATARWAGNSAAVITQHYLGVGTPEDAARFYALRPKTGNVIAMTSKIDGAEPHEAVG